VSGETGDVESGWTVDTLHAHVQQRMNSLQMLLDERYATQTKAVESAFSAADRAVNAALLAAEKAVGKAESAAEKRFDAVNEFRGQLADQASTFMPRAEAETRLQALAEKIDDLATRIDKSEGRGTGLNAGWVYLLAAIAAVGTIITVYVALRGG
jgi:hypothetical protein